MIGDSTAGYMSHKGVLPQSEFTVRETYKVGFK